MATKKLLLTLAVGAVTMMSLAAQAKNGFYQTRFPWNVQAPAPHFMVGDAAAPAPTGNLLYYGGPVISNVKAYVLFWGPNVNSQTVSQISGLYKAVTNSTFMDWLNQYNTKVTAVDGNVGTNQGIGRGSFGATITLKPINTATTIDDVGIQAELQAQVAAGVLPTPDDNTLFMIYFPPGMTITADGATSCQDFCAYHGFAGTPTTAHIFYGVMPDLGGMCALGCGAAATSFQSLTSISGHEFTEAVTDPFPTPGSSPAYPQAWNDNQGSEIGDLCETSGGNNNLVAGGTTWIIQSVWDNSKSSCTTQSWSSP